MAADKKVADLPALAPRAAVAVKVAGRPSAIASEMAAAVMVIEEAAAMEVATAAVVAVTAAERAAVAFAELAPRVVAECFVDAALAAATTLASALMAEEPLLLQRR